MSEKKQDENLTEQLGKLIQSHADQEKNLKQTLAAIGNLQQTLARKHARRLWELLGQLSGEFSKGTIRELYDQVQGELQALADNEPGYADRISSYGVICDKGPGFFYVDLLKSALTPGVPFERFMNAIFEKRLRDKDNPFIKGGDSA